MGSSIDVNTIVQNLMYVERAPIRTMESKVSTLEKKVSAYQSLNTKLSTLSGKLNELLFGSSTAPLAPPFGFLDRLSKSLFSKCAMVSSDETAISATSTTGTSSGSYAITVNSLAQAQTTVSSGFADTTSTSIGTGTVTLTTGNGNPVLITIDSSNSTLSGLRDAINNAQAGVTATIINDGSATPYRLMLTASGTGLAGAFTIEGNLSGGQAPTFQQTQAASDAQFSINGVAISKSSNTISDVISGVTFTLKKASAGPVTLQAERDSDSVVSALKEFVSAYNEVSTFINAQFTYSAGTKDAGPLAGDPTLRRIQSMLQNPIIQSARNQYTSYAVAGQVGLEFNRDGSLTFNESKFREAFNLNPSSVAALFLGNGTQAGGMTSSDSRVHYSGRTTATQAGTYAVRVDTLAQQASAVGNQLISSLSQDETLTISDGNATAVIFLAQNDSLVSILSKINSALLAQGISATASDDGTGKIGILSSNYGSAQSLTISSDQSDLPGTTGFGTMPVTVTGTDIAGTINGHAATGSGLTLTGAVGQPEEGLSVAISQTTPGSYGSVTIAPDATGVVGSSVLMGLFTALDGLTDSLSGPITTATDGLKKNIDSLKDQIDQYEVRLAAREKLLTAEYDRADQALRLLTVTQASLSNQINALSKQ